MWTIRSSLVMRPVNPRSNATERILAATMLLGALVLTAAATLIWLSGDDGDNKKPAPIATDAISAASTATPTTEVRETENAPVVEPAAQPTILPTAAADEIAVALLTPAPIEPVAFERSSQPFTIARGTGRTRVIQYTVQEGDTLETIAEKFGLSSFWTLIWSNSRTIYNSLRPGSQLNIMPEDGVYYGVARSLTIQELADQYQVDPYMIIDSDYNPDLYGSTPQTLLVESMWVVISGGKGEEITCSRRLPMQAHRVSSRVVIRCGAARQMLAPDRCPSPVPSAATNLCRVSATAGMKR